MHRDDSGYLGCEVLEQLGVGLRLDLAREPHLACPRSESDSLVGILPVNDVAGALELRRLRGRR